VFKFVVGDLSDYNEIDELVKQYNLSPVYIMPEGIKAEKIQETLQAITAAALERGYHITTRMQILIHGNKRAV
jgi:hypothetical protein